MRKKPLGSNGFEVKQLWNRCNGVALDANAKPTTLAGGVGNGYFVATQTGGSGFDSRPDRKVPDALTGEHREKTVAACSPAITFR